MALAKLSDWSIVSPGKGLAFLKHSDWPSELTGHSDWPITIKLRNFRRLLTMGR